MFSIKITMAGAISGLALLALSAPASAASVTVPGSADPFLAAQPAGTNCCGGDSAPAQSPVLVAGALTGGQMLTFSATGGVSYGGGAPGAGADGDNDGTNYTYRFSMTPDDGTGVAGAQNVNVDGLVGVFVSGTPSGAAPTPLDFGGSGASTGLDFATLSPGLDQIFWIGDGLTGIGTGAVQQFYVPTGATALYLGTVDGSGWFNNSGAFVVTINGLAGGVPEPASWALMLLGVGAMGAALRGRRGLAAA
jgi:hypothetical protein